MDFKWDAFENSIAFVAIGAIVILGALFNIDAASSNVAIAAIAGLAGQNRSS